LVDNIRVGIFAFPISQELAILSQIENGQSLMIKLIRVSFGCRLLVNPPLLAAGGLRQELGPGHRDSQKWSSSNAGVG